ISVGIGLFLAFIGLKEAGFMMASESTLVTLGDFTKLPVIVSFLGLVLTAVLIKRKVKGALLIGIVASTLIAVIINYISGFKAYPASEYARIPQHILSTPDFSTIGHFDFGVFAKVGVISAVVVIFSIMLSDFFDTLGTVIGIGGEGKFLTPDGKLPKIKQVLLVDSLAAAMGGVTSASSVTTYIESAAGISVGGRSGLTNIFVGILFILAIFFSPLAGVIPKQAVAPALIIVGFLMLPIIKEIPFTKFDEAFPAFLIMILMPLTYSISNGIGAGFILFTLIKLLTGKGKEVHWLMYIVSLAFAVDFMIPVLKMVFGF
ncbi:MAG: NCS2 family permease, partial [candidate division Zixibacteria bacterium]|nr:NCS2 family permease [candidate division Zixibacteria bacterium]